MHALMSPSLITLPDGLRLVHIHEPRVAGAILGLAVGSGSADEESDQYGLAHFVEHTIFKGTPRRRSWHIINRMEALGGELNAYTTKESTVVYSVFPRGGVSRAADLLGDLASSATFPESEIEKEREVVTDEILSYRDTPSEAVYDDFEDLLFSNTPLGHNILGNPQSVKALTSAQCRDFLHRHYTRANTTVFYAGPHGTDHIADLVAHHFAALPQGDKRKSPSSGIIVNPAPFAKEVRLPIHQCHVVMGIPIGGLSDPGRHTAALLANMLGGPGMNSLLNIELRERRGLVYTVETSATFYRRCGMLSIYFGCDREDLDRCTDLVRRTCRRIADGTLLTPRRLQAAKKQYLGQRALAMENRETRAFGAARSVVLTGMAPDYDAVVQGIDSVDADTLQGLAAQLTRPSELRYIP